MLANEPFGACGRKKRKKKKEAKCLLRCIWRHRQNSQSKAGRYWCRPSRNRHCGDDPLSSYFCPVCAFSLSFVVCILGYSETIAMSERYVCARYSMRNFACLLCGREKAMPIYHFTDQLCAIVQFISRLEKTTLMSSVAVSFSSLFRILYSASVSTRKKKCI